MHLFAEGSHLPGLSLWVFGVEVGEKLRVRQVPEAGGIICHAAAISADVGDLVVASVVASM